MRHRLQLPTLAPWFMVLSLLACQEQIIRKVVIVPCNSSDIQATVTDASAGNDLVQTSAADADAQASPDSDAGALAAEVTPAEPMVATGQFTVVADPLTLQMPLDPGIEKSKVPRDNAGVFFDYDSDGLWDVAMTDGLHQVWIAHGTGPWQWSPTLVLSTAAPGLTTLAPIDLSGQGKIGLAVGGSSLILLVQNAQGQWQDQAKLRGFVDAISGGDQAVVATDVDEDGLQDLLVTRFACGPTSQMLAFVNQGDGTFVESSADLGLDQKATLWNALPTDMDGDGHTDLLTMVEGCDPQSGNAYLHNRGPVAGKRYERLVLPPAFLQQGSVNSSPMGGAVADFNGDGLLDLILSGIGLRDLRSMLGSMKPPVAIGDVSTQDLKSYQQSATQLFVRQPSGALQPDGADAGIIRPLSKTGLTMVSWSTLPLDFDADGHLDLFLSHAYDYGAFVLADEGGTRPVLFRNQGNGTFLDVSKTLGLPDQHIGRALAAADVDADGDLDLLIGGENDLPLWLRNDVVHGGQVLHVRLVGQLSNHFGLQARVKLQTSQRILLAQMGGYAPSHTTDVPDVALTLRKGELAKTIEITWPSGYVQKVDWPSATSLLTVAEPVLLQVSARKVLLGQTVVVTARTFDSSATPTPQVVPQIEVSIGSKGGNSADLVGTWLGPQSCTAGTCTRTWQAPNSGGGFVALAVTVNGKPWNVQPILRWSSGN